MKTEELNTGVHGKNRTVADLISGYAETELNTDHGNRMIVRSTEGCYQQHSDRKSWHAGIYKAQDGRTDEMVVGQVMQLISAAVIILRI